MPINADQTSAYPKPQTLLEDWPQIANSADWEPGQQLGPYVLKERLGKGGMGVVWLAEQLAPLKRYVAIKLMAHEQRSAMAEAYFEIERQALAQLSHRAIAQIYDAGRLPDGAMFFAMEYVPGVPLDRFQQEHRLSSSQLAALFVQIASGVQHAHQRGLIHRDLKPMNVLVHWSDSQALPKIIDFGIAMGSIPGAAMKIDQTRSVGTPAYMSPEQKRPGDGGIDARTDVYALGMMLAESLARAGGLSTESGAIDSAVFRNAVAKRLGSTTERAIDSAFLDRALAGAPRELLAIAAKALSTDRELRYDTASALADDLQRWLAKRPVLAYNGGRLYEFGCLVRRNRIASVAVVMIGAAILIGTLLALHGMREAQRAQALAEQRRNDAEQLIQYMLGDFADKLRPIGRLELLDGVGSKALDYLSTNTPSDEQSSLIRARALRTLGEVQVTRQQFEQAERTLSQAAALLEPWRAAPSDAEVFFESGNVAFWRGNIAFRQQDDRRANDFWTQYLHDAQALVARNGEARSQLEVAYAFNNLGSLARRTGNSESAVKYFTASIEIRRRHAAPDDLVAQLDLVDSLSWIASAQLDAGDAAAAWITTNEVLSRLGQLDATDHARHRQLSINNLLMLGLQAKDVDDVDLARDLLKEAYGLAIVDVANDPTQLRRQAFLANIAFELAAIDPGAGDVLKQGEKALLAIRTDVAMSAEVMDLLLARELAYSAHGRSAERASDLHKVIDAVLDQQPSLRQMVRVLDLSSQHVDLLRAAGVDRIGKLNASLESYSVKRGQSLRFRRSAQKFLTATGQTQRANELSEAIRRQVASVQAIKEAS